MNVLVLNYWSVKYIKCDLNKSLTKSDFSFKGHFFNANYLGKREDNHSIL